jgi:hypothetical protein
MMRRSPTLLVCALTALLGAGPAVAQSEGVGGDDVIEVVGVEYAYQGLPTEVPAGTSLGFRNDGSEVHELLVYRVNDGVDAALEELLAMPEEEVAGLVELVGEGPLIAMPGALAEGSVPLEREGRYAVVCFIPQGLSAELFEALPTAAGPGDLTPELQAAPPHVALGMVQEFAVAAADGSASADPGVGAVPGTDPPSDGGS